MSLAKDMKIVHLEDADCLDFVPCRNAFYITNMTQQRRFVLKESSLDSLRIVDQTAIQFVTCSNTEGTGYDIVWQLGTNEIVGVFSGSTQHWFLMKIDGKYALISGPV